MSANDLQRAAEREARLVDELTDTFASELAQVLKLLSARIRRWAAQLDTSEGRISRTRVNLTLALQVRQVIVQTLREAGYHGLVAAATDTALDRLASTILRSGTEGAMLAGWAGLDVDVLVALKDTRFAQLLAQGEHIQATLWRVVLDGIVGARPVVDLVDDVEDALEISHAQARNVYDTAVSTFSREVEQMHATNEADEAFFYVGPVDRKMRPFCKERAGQVYTREQIDQMDNGQLPNPLITGGGYNCRHMFKRVSPLDQELLELVGTGQRHQAVQDRMDDTARAGASA